MGVQLSLKAALPLAERIATASDRCCNTGPLLLALADHQQTWFWLSRINGLLSFMMEKTYIYLCRARKENSNIFLCFPHFHSKYKHFNRRKRIWITAILFRPQYAKTYKSNHYPAWTNGTRTRLCNIGYPSENILIKSRENSFAHNVFPGYPIVLKFCTEYSSATVMPCGKFQKDWRTETDFKRTRLWVTMSFGRISHIALLHNLSRPQ